MTDLQPQHDHELAHELDDLLEHAASLRAEALAENTRRAYASDLRALARWADKLPATRRALICVFGDEHGARAPLPVEVVSAFLSHCDREGLSHSTIKRRASAISTLHRCAGLDSPTSSQAIREILAGIRRTHARGGRAGKARPFTVEMARAALPQLPTPERALLLVGLIGGLRRSEIISLQWGWIERSSGGLAVTLGGTKNRAEGGHTFGLPRTTGDAATGCPVAALVDLEAEAHNGAADPEALVFPISASTVRRIVRTAARLAGVNPKLYSPHSLRAGMCSIAADAGVSLGTIMDQSGHRSSDVAAGYISSAVAPQNAAAIAVARALGDPPPTSPAPDPLP